MTIALPVTPVMEVLLDAKAKLFYFLSKMIIYAFMPSVSFQLFSIIIHYFTNPPSWKKIKCSRS
jgi:hypothetical protein